MSKKKRDWKRIRAVAWKLFLEDVKYALVFTTLLALARLVSGKINASDILSRTLADFLILLASLLALNVILFVSIFIRNKTKKRDSQSKLEDD